ncbi:nucleolar MIF4G domain-containing protein 1 [Caerostris extrusa]|uniref:Nucleolar MIF4G domain-containing protein 1 n=1 Tax=Caerostris extrusa TaxID=172846 RepID=A0AAV4MSG3_CAEEX|nr:nucleolar MIF4G domain-containing protein 1 [Caerostris extrusa]
MPAKPFKRKTVERLRVKRQRFKKPLENSKEIPSRKTNSKKAVRFVDEVDQSVSRNSKNMDEDQFPEEESLSESHLPKKKRQKKSHSVESVRKLQLLEANEEEDKSISRLEKLLKLKKRKNKKLPAAFKDEGLEYLLEVVDSKVNKAGILSYDDDGLEEDIAAVKGESAVKNSESKTSKRPQPKQRTLTELLEEKEGIVSTKDTEAEKYDEEEGFSDLDHDSQSDCSDAQENFDENDVTENFDEEEIDEQDSTSEISPEKEKKKPKVWEDIYGRLRDESGNLIKTSETTNNLYVPPKLRKQNGAEDESTNEKHMRIKRQLKGLLNRLSESNLQSICNQVEAMYLKYSRNDMNETLFHLMSELLFTSSLTPPRLIMEQAMLIVLLHANVGPEIGAYFLQHIVEKLGTLLKSFDNYDEGKECNNVLTFLSHLYNFKVTHSTLMFDIFQILVESFNSKDIELIQLLLKHVGFVLRKDDPLKLKELVFAIQAKAAAFNKDQNDVKFMLDILIAIRNNNMYKIPDYDPSIVEHGKKFLRGLVRKGCSIQELAISYEDLLKVEERGRWWIVGSAWKESDDNAEKKPRTIIGNQLLKTDVNEEILELARKQHMGTDVRKAVFCAIMSAEDYMDAFQKLLKLNLKNEQERQIIDVIQFSDMDKPMVRFFRQILLAILLDDNEEVCKHAFTRIAKAENLKMLRVSLKLFMHHFLLKNQTKLEPEVASKLKSRVGTAESAMNSCKSIF